MKPDNPKEYMIASLKNLIQCVEEGKIALENIQEEPIGYPIRGYEHIIRGRKITLELYYANKERN